MLSLEPDGLDLGAVKACETLHRQAGLTEKWKRQLEKPPFGQKFNGNLGGGFLHIFYFYPDTSGNDPI